jgi:hypothetical protein
MTLIDAIGKEAVRVHLAEREPDLVDRADAAGVTLFTSLRTAVAAQITIIVGVDPAPGPVRDLAVQAAAYEIASQFEYACFPEQQTAGNIGRGWFLHQRFEQMLATLKGAASGTDLGAIAVGLPMASFPAARTYPDPID